MKLLVNLDTNQFVQKGGTSLPINNPVFVRGDKLILDIYFYEQGSAVSADLGSIPIVFGGKARAKFDGDYLFQTSVYSKETAGADTFYRFTLDLHTTQLNGALEVDAITTNDVSELPVNIELQRTEGTLITSTTRQAATVQNDVNKGTEGIPTGANPSYATSGELAAEIVARQAGDTGNAVFHTVEHDSTPLDLGSVLQSVNKEMLTQSQYEEGIQDPTSKWFFYDFHANQIDHVNRKFLQAEIFVQNFGSVWNTTTWTSDVTDLGGTRGSLKWALPISDAGYSISRFGYLADNDNFVDPDEWTLCRFKTLDKDHLTVFGRNVYMGINPAGHASNIVVNVGGSYYDTGVDMEPDKFYLMGFRLVGKLHPTSGYSNKVQWVVQDEDGVQLATGSQITANISRSKTWIELFVQNKNTTTGAQVCWDFIHGKRDGTSPRIGSLPVKLT